MLGSAQRVGRVVGLGEALRGDSIFTGHIVVLTLMKRLQLVSYRDRHGRRAEPDHVEKFFMPQLAGYVEHANPDVHTYTITPAKRSPFGELWWELHREVTKRREATPMVSATRADLYRMAVYLVRKIDECEPASEEYNEYPQGWRAAYDLIKHGRPTPAQIEEAAPDEEPEQPKNPRGEVLDVLDFVSEKLRTDYDDVLQRIGKTRATLVLEDKAALLALVR